MTNQSKLTDIFAKIFVLGCLSLFTLGLYLNFQSFLDEQTRTNYLYDLVNNEKKILSLTQFSVVSGSSPLMRNNHRGAVIKGVIVETEVEKFGFPFLLEYIEPGTPVYVDNFDSERVFCLIGKQTYCGFEIPLVQL